MYANDHVLLVTLFLDVYNCTDEDELEYLKQFSKQLFLDDSELQISPSIVHILLLGPMIIHILLLLTLIVKKEFFPLDD